MGGAQPPKILKVTKMQFFNPKNENWKQLGPTTTPPHLLKFKSTLCHSLNFVWKFDADVSIMTYKTVSTAQPAYLHSALKQCAPSVS